MRISAAAKVALSVFGGMVDTLARRGRAVPLGAGGICWAVRVENFSFRVNRILSFEGVSWTMKAGLKIYNKPWIEI